MLMTMQYNRYQHQLKQNMGCSMSAVTQWENHVSMHQAASQQHVQKSGVCFNTHGNLTTTRKTCQQK